MPLDQVSPNHPLRGFENKHNPKWNSGFKASAGWQNHGNCVICGVWGVLESRCTRCEKRSCGEERCKKLVKQLSMCGVPKMALKSRRGDLVESPSSLVAPSA